MNWLRLVWRELMAGGAAERGWLLVRDRSLGVRSFVVLSALLVSGCATPTKGVEITALDNMPAARGPLIVMQPPSDPPLAVLKVSTLKLAVPLVPDRVAEADERIRSSDVAVFASRDLAAMLRDSKLFGKVVASEPVPDTVPAGSRTVMLRLTAEETSDRHVAGGAGKSFASGFFTLGLAPISAHHTFSSAMTLTATRWDGMTRAYKASSSVTASWSQPPGAVNQQLFQQAVAKSSVRATAENWRSLIGQMVQDASFFATQATLP